MRVSVDPGTYVVAASGGVDSMVLLDILRQRPNVKLIVAHFDHGMREDSHLDRKLVEETARRHGLMFVHDQAHLGKNASEAVARTARYKFLHRVKEASRARAIITAHHKDDAQETAILNLLRGSGRRGLTSLRSTGGIIRPLLEYDKEHIRDYAKNHAIAWREDTSNTDLRYMRNYIRHHIIPRLSLGQRAQLAILLQELHAVNDELDAHVVNMLHTQPRRDTITRNWFVHLPHDIAREVVYGWLRHHDVKDIDRSTVERLIIAIKTSHVGKKVDIDKHWQLLITKQHAQLKPRPKTKKHLKKTVQAKPR